jgi:hypothetical protein
MAFHSTRRATACLFLLVSLAFGQMVITAQEPTPTPTPEPTIGLEQLRDAQNQTTAGIWLLCGLTFVAIALRQVKP